MLIIPGIYVALSLVLDDFINPKTGRNIFGCSHIFDHAAKANQFEENRAQ
jgi:hypothetical protein